MLTSLAHWLQDTVNPFLTFSQSLPHPVTSVLGKAFVTRVFDVTRLPAWIQTFCAHWPQRWKKGEREREKKKADDYFCLTHFLSEPTCCRNIWARRDLKGNRLCANAFGVRSEVLPIITLQNLSVAFRHLPPKSARTGYATERAFFISAQLHVHRRGQRTSKGLGTNN